MKYRYRYRPPWDGVSRRFLMDSSDEVDDMTSDKTWLWVYTGSLFVSFLATLVASNHMRKLGGDVFRSAVRFVTTSFLICTSIHALAAGLFYAFLIATMDSWVDDVEWHAQKFVNDHKGNGSHSGPPPPSLEDIVGSGSGMVDDVIESLLKKDNKNDGGEAAFLSKLAHQYIDMPKTLTLLLCLENIFFVMGAYWIFLLTLELYQLAKRTHDRGYRREREQIRKYASGAMAILIFFLGSGILILAMRKGYGSSYRILSIVELVTIILSIFFSCGALLRLKFTGRKKEHVHGMLMASPLYRRLKLMMLVCIVFTLPYSGVQLALIGVKSSDVDNIPDYVVGVVTMLYYLFGAAQAFVMGGSQQCCVRLLQPIIPAHLKNTPEWRALQGARQRDSCVDVNGVVIPAPEQPIFVNTDIESSSALWAQAPQHVIDEAQRVHDDLLRSLLPKYRGYEITTAGDAFQLAFHTIEEAVSYCLEAQLLLVQAKWPSEIHGLVDSTKTERECNLKLNTIFKGLRVRMGIHDSHPSEGSLITQVHPVTGKTLYIGASELLAREIGDVGFGGQIIMSKRITSYLRDNEDKVTIPFVVDYYGSHGFACMGFEMDLYELTPKLVEARRKIFRKRRVAVQNENKSAKDIPSTPTASSGSSNESTGEESTTEFRAQRSPTEAERMLWSSV